MNAMLEVRSAQSPSKMKSSPFPLFALWMTRASIGGLICHALIGQAQPTDAGQAAVQWVSIGGTDRVDSLSAMAVSPSGVVYCVGDFGYDSNTSARYAETVLFQYNATGQLAFSKPKQGDALRAIMVDDSENYFITGMVSEDSRGVGRRFDFYIAKYDLSGTLLWERAAGTLNDLERSPFKDTQQGWALALAPDGGVYVVGSSTGPAVFGDTQFPNGPGGPLICRYSRDGSLLWAKRAEGRGLVSGGNQLGGGEARYVALDQSGNVLISGSMWNGPATFDGLSINIKGPYSSGAFAAKYSPTGQILWAKPVPFGDVSVDREGNTLVSGPLDRGQAVLDGRSIPVDDPSAHGSFVAKFDPAGQLLWVKAAPIGGLMADRLGNVYTGSAKLDPAGELLWIRTIPGATLSVRALNTRDEPVYTGTIKGSVDFDEHRVASDQDAYDDGVICRVDVNGRFQWAFGLVTGNLEPGLVQGNVSFGKVWIDRDGNVTISGSVNCPWSGELQTHVCDGAAKLGDFPIAVQAGGINDFWLARISDPAPTRVALTATRTASGLALSWPGTTTGFSLESTASLTASVWTTVSAVPVVEGNQNVVTIKTETGPQFFRLSRP